MDPNCQRCRHLLSAAMDGETNPSEDSFIRRHLATCEDCLEVQAAYRQIRSQMRTLSRPVPPPQLRTAVMARTRGQGQVVPRSRGGSLRPRFSLSQSLALGALGLLVVIFGTLVIIGVLRSTSSLQVAGQPEVVAGTQTIIVPFNSPLDEDFIKANAQSLELFEVKDAQGNPLEIDYARIQVSGSKVELPVKDRINENQKIEVEVKPEVKASNGTSLNSVVRQTVKITTPTPTPVITTPPPTNTAPAPTATAVITTTAAPTVTSGTGNGGPPATPTVPLPTAVPVTATPGPTATRTPTTPTPTAVATTPAPTVTVTATVGATPTIAVTPTITPTVTATPTITATVTDSPTPAVTPTVTTVAPTATPLSAACQVTLQRGFGKLYNDRPDIAQKIGCPTAEENQASLVYQPFQHGFMLWHKQSGQIYVFYSNGSWVRFADPGPGELPTPAPTAPGATPVPTITPTPTPVTGCSFSPVRGFGNIWATRPTVRNALGCPLVAESGTDGGAFQPFAKGVMYFSPIASNGRRDYVLFNDTTFQDVLDTFQG